MKSDVFVDLVGGKTKTLSLVAIPRKAKESWFATSSMLQPMACHMIALTYWARG